MVHFFALWKISSEDSCIHCTATKNNRKQTFPGILIITPYATCVYMEDGVDTYVGHLKGEWRRILAHYRTTRHSSGYWVTIYCSASEDIDGNKAGWHILATANIYLIVTGLEREVTASQFSACSSVTVSEWRTKSHCFRLSTTTEPRDKPKGGRRWSIVFPGQKKLWYRREPFRCTPFSCSWRQSLTSTPNLVDSSTLKPI